MRHGPRRAPLRSDARRNRERILEVALAELTSSAETPLSTIARKAGVGQGTFYRNFPSRESLVLEVYRYEMQQVAETAHELLRTRPPQEALREWMARLARYATAKAGLAEALRSATSSRGTLAGVGHAPVTAAVATLLEANTRAGTIRSGVSAEDFLLAVAGLWQIAPYDDEGRRRASRLLDLVMDGLSAGAPGAPGAPRDTAD